MITIITGDVNIGKTTALINLFNINRQGDGFALPKFFISGKPADQDIIRLSTGEKKIFSFSDEFDIPYQPECFR